MKKLINNVEIEAVPLLIGLGIHSLSVNFYKIPEVKQKIRNISN
jgi:phosphoenolpyruvate-protein kinase (PTS system EI component)